MGGKGSGGRRVGAGRKRISDAAGMLSGSRRVRARAKAANQTNQTGNQNGPAADAPQAAAPAAPIETEIPQPPGNLTLDELAEWNDLAPRAAKMGTLTPDTQWALVDLCRARVLMTRLWRDIDRIGNVVLDANGKYAANPLLARFTTLKQRIEADMLRFRLSPRGESLVEPEKPADPFAAFDAPVPLKTGGDGETVN